MPGERAGDSLVAVSDAVAAHAALQLVFVGHRRLQARGALRDGEAGHLQPLGDGGTTGEHDR